MCVISVQKQEPLLYLFLSRYFTLVCVCFTHIKNKKKCVAMTTYGLTGSKGSLLITFFIFIFIFFRFFCTPTFSPLSLIFHTAVLPFYVKPELGLYSSSAYTHTHTYREVRFSPSFGVPFLVRFKQHQIFGVNEFRFYVD